MLPGALSPIPMPPGPLAHAAPAKQAKAKPNAVLIVCFIAVLSPCIEKQTPPISSRCQCENIL